MSDTGALVYVVDDDASAREGVANLLRSAGLTVTTFASAEEFLAAPRTKSPSCLVLDVNLPGLSGLELQEELAKSKGQVPIIFLTGHGDIPMSVRAVRAGAVNFLTKPVDDEELLNAIEQCVTCYEDGIRSDHNVGSMVGESVAFQDVLRAVQVVAPTDSTVLIQGETGTGKELVARAIHGLSSRSKRPFVMLNCAAIPATLLESELFGHEKGAFTGAFAQKVGRYEMAHQGTLFLDEIGEMPLELQPKLLRVLQEREFERLGSNRTIHADVRIIAATNRNLTQMVEEGKFRSDLYYRLHVFPLAVPPLRERREDIPLLIRHFAQKYAKKLNRIIDEIPSDVLDALAEYGWPGNIRELQNLVERSVILSPGRVLQIAVPNGNVNGPITQRNNTAQKCDAQSVSTFRDAERRAIIHALRASAGKVAGAGGAAERLGLKRTTLQNKMRLPQISRSDYISEGSGARL
jgi:DNA-binding NtrC family response regulator